MKQLFFTSALLCLIIVSCKNQNKNVGPCDYYYNDFKAQIKGIEPFMENGKELFHVKMEFDNSILYKEIQLLEELKNIEIDSAFIKRNNLKVGNIYTGTVSEIKEGDCQPLFVSFNHDFS